MGISLRTGRLCCNCKKLLLSSEIRKGWRNLYEESCATAVCKNQRLCAKIRKTILFAIVYFLKVCPSYNLTTTCLTYNPFLYIRSVMFCESFDLLFIPPRLLIEEL
jgi:hypothetical protein